MTAQKVTVKVEMQSLHIDVISGMLSEVSQHIRDGVESGSLYMEDGDYITWQTTREPVTF
jgi:hypothetical protein